MTYAEYSYKDANRMYWNVECEALDTHPEKRRWTVNYSTSSGGPSYDIIATLEWKGQYDEAPSQNDIAQLLATYMTNIAIGLGAHAKLEQEHTDD